MPFITPGNNQGAAIRTFTLSPLAIAMMFSAQICAAESSSELSDIEVVSVYGEPFTSNSATKLNLSIAETPQTISVISAKQIEDFELNDVEALLSYAPGVTVERVETDRIYYTARGFDIVNFQTDGVGVPFSAGLSHGHLDTAVYEQVEIIKGAAGLITGLANPSATINYIRKRPGKQFDASVGLTLGDNNKVRLEGDVSGVLTQGVRGRAVVVKDQSDSYLDRKEDDNQLFYGIVEADLSDSTVLTIGYSNNNNDVKGSLSGALPLYYSDGSPTDYDVSTSTATDWAYRDITQSQAFVELKQGLSDNWELYVQFTQNKIDHDSELFYVYGVPDKTTEEGLYGYAYGYDLDEQQKIVDAFVSGSFTLGGRQHQLIAGFNYADIHLFGQSYYNYAEGFPVLGADWASGSTPAMEFNDYDPYTTGHSDAQHHASLYVASRLNITEGLSVLVGARHMSVKQQGYSYGTDSQSDAQETVPYVGLVYALNNNLSVYGSYSEVFTPQSFVDPDFKTLGVAQGDNTEAGLKYELDSAKATATLAVFRSDLKNVGEFQGVVDGVNTYLGLDYSTDGAEFEVTGAVNNNLNVSVGYTWLHSVEGEQGQSVRTYVPRKLLKMAGSYQFEQLPSLSVGASVRWQDDIYTTDGTVRIEQDSYAIVDAFVRYAATDDWLIALNVSNLSDKKYLNSLLWTQGYYGAPRMAQVSATYHF